MVNEQIIQLLRTSQKIVWSTVSKSIERLIKDQPKFSTLYSWMTTTVMPKGTHLKTLYVDQLKWNHDWKEIIDNNSGIDFFLVFINFKLYELINLRIGSY